MKKLLSFFAILLSAACIAQPTLDTLNNDYLSKFYTCASNESGSDLIYNIIATEVGQGANLEAEIWNENGTPANSFNVTESILNGNEVAVNVRFNGGVAPGTFKVGVVVKNNVSTLPSDTLKYTFIGQGDVIPPYVIEPGYFCVSEGSIDLAPYFIDPNTGTTSSFELWSPNGPLDVLSQDGVLDLTRVTEEMVNNSPYDIFFEVESEGGCYDYIDWDWYNYVLFPPDVITTVSDATDCSSNNGQISMTVSGSHPSLDYLAYIPTGDSIVITGGGSFSNLYSGVYNITVEDDSGCVTTLSESIESPEISVSGLASDVSCTGFNDGAIDISISAIGPYSVYWEHGEQIEDISNLAPGHYTVVVTSDAGCQTSKTFTVNDYELHLDAYSYYYDCYDPAYSYSGRIEAYSNTLDNRPFTFVLPLPAGVTADNDSIHYNYDPGTYPVTVTDNNGCSVTKNFTIGVYTDFDAFISNVTPSDCGTSSGSIELELNFYDQSNLVQSSWNTGETSSDIYNLAPGTYTYTMEHLTSSVCDFVLEVEVPAFKPLINELCLITVDTISTTNVLVWEELETTGIDHYNIYRKNNSGVYVKIGETDAADESYYNDTYASPLIQSWSYKITAVNDCGIESDKSASHRTIHLRREINGSDVTLNWNDYEGFNYTDHVIHRFTASTGWEEITDVPKSQNSFTDTPPDMTGLDYAIEVDPGYSCESSKATSHNASRSNRSNGVFSPNDGYTPPIDDSNVEELVGLNITMYPNPTSSDVTITVNGANNGTMHVTGMNGQLISSKVFNNNRIVYNTDDLSNGIYLITIESNDYTIVKKLVVNH